MKKKLMLCAAAVFAAATISLSSCGGNPVDKAVSLFKEATEQVKNAKSYDELQDIEGDLEAKLEKLEDSNKDFEPTDAQKDAVKDAQKAYNKAKREAKKNL
ncbi:MAG: hypothetical protein BHV69_03625 [Bacteroidales bacterium 52_46]|nr:MAG: hypothetical protein BHV69_03625 [Bacteroidales bacterium 52_46]